MSTNSISKMRLQKIKIINLNKYRFILTDGFHYSGSSIINDIFKSAGYQLPENIRCDEIHCRNDNFSWPLAISNSYDEYSKIKLAFKLLKVIMLRIPKNIVQKTIFYSLYLKSVGRADSLHTSSSVNRSLWSYFLSFYMVTVISVYNRTTFINWLLKKYFWVLRKSPNVVLDKGLPTNDVLAAWMFEIKNTLGFIVYRNPRVQYQQIASAYRATNQIVPSYKDFLTSLLSQYESKVWLTDTSYNLIFIYFDRLISDRAYRDELAAFLRRNGYMQNLTYDFARSEANNKELARAARTSKVDEICMVLEQKITDYHRRFEAKSSETIKNNPLDKN